MKIITLIIIAIYNLVLFLQINKKRNVFGLGNIINFAVNINFIMYLLGWSDYIQKDPKTGTYIIIISINLVFIWVMIKSNCPIECILSNNDMKINLKQFVYGHREINIYLLINIVYILLFFIENYMGSRSFIPNLVGIDIHTYSGPLISYFTRSIYVMLILNYIAYITFNKKIYLVFFVLDVLLFPIFRGARLNMFMSILEFGLFFVIYNIKFITKNKEKFLKIISIVLIIVCIGIYVGNKRIEKQYEKSETKQITYSDLIAYNGPKDKLGILSWYYGYFPMSFANLDKTVRYIDYNNIKTNGLYTARPLFVGILKLNKLIPNYPDTEYVDSISQYYTTSATVGTGYKEFYLDFRYFVFIPIAIYALISLCIYNKIAKDIYYLSIYAYIAGSWFFMSFQNIFIDIAIYNIIFLYLIKILFVKNKKSQLGGEVIA